MAADPVAEALPPQGSRELTASEVRSRDGPVALEACPFMTHYFQLGPASLDGLQLPSQYHQLETKVSGQMSLWRTSHI